MSAYRVDAHQHYWRYHPQEHGWITEDLAVLKQNFLPSQAWPLMKASGYHASVAVQASQHTGETDFLLDLARANPFIWGVVGWVDLQAENLREVLQRYSTFPQFKGVRHLIQDEADPDFMLSDSFVRGLKVLAQADLSYDLLIRPPQFNAALRLLKKLPENFRIVLDHLGKPSIRTQEFLPWRKALKELARFPNLRAKVSGLVTEAQTGQWKAADFTPYLDTAWECFGAERLMVGSDWPVCLLGPAEYRQCMDIVESFLGQFHEQERNKVLGENAIAFYQLKKRE